MWVHSFIVSEVFCSFSRRTVPSSWAIHQKHHKQSIWSYCYLDSWISERQSKISLLFVLISFYSLLFLLQRTSHTYRNPSFSISGNNILGIALIALNDKSLIKDDEIILILSFLLFFLLILWIATMVSWFQYFKKSHKLTGFSFQQSQLKLFK